MAVREFMAAGRLRGAVKAEADAAIATKTAAGLLIFENMIDADLLGRRLVLTRLLRNKTSSESQRIKPGVRVQFRTTDRRRRGEADRDQTGARRRVFKNR